MNGYTLEVLAAPGPRLTVLAPNQYELVLAPPAGPSLILLAAAQQGPPGRNGRDFAAYEHVQGTPALTWTINHNLGYRPNVSVYSAGGVEILAEVRHLSANQTQVFFVQPTGGFARCI